MAQVMMRTSKANSHWKITRQITSDTTDVAPKGFPPYFAPVEEMIIGIEFCTVEDLNILMQDHTLASLLYKMLISAEDLAFNGETKEMAFSRSLVADRCDEINRSVMADFVRLPDLPEFHVSVAKRRLYLVLEETVITNLQATFKMPVFSTLAHAKIECNVVVPIVDRDLFSNETRRYEQLVEISDYWWIPPLNLSADKFCS